MKRTIFSISLFFSLVLMFSACSSNETPSNTQIPTTPSEPQDPLTRGRILFVDNCSLCHGTDGTAGIGNAANLPASKLDSALVIETITNGKNTMPAFKSQLSAEEIKQLADFVISLRK